MAIGKTYISATKHTSNFHINLTEIENSLFNIKNILIQLDKDILNKKQNESFSILTFYKFNQTSEYLQTILRNTKIFHKFNRQKRGLLNVVGKVDKWLFGTLDSDDETRYNNYFNTLTKNQDILNKNFYKEQSILSTVTQEYTKNLDKINNNQLLILEKINLLDKNQLNLSSALYISLILDNVMLQLNTLNSIINNIENAISFAHVNKMHNSILNPNQLLTLIENIKTIYGPNRIPEFKELINFYNYLSVQVIIKNNSILFSIHTPIILPTHYILHKIFPIPIVNKTILLSNPYILLTKEDYWTTEEECPQLEDLFICKQTALSKDEHCLFELLKTSNNMCPMINVKYTKSTIQRLYGNEILVIPVNETIARDKCHRGLYKFSEPSIVSISSCPVEIGNLTFEIETKTEFQYVLELPKFSYSQDSNNISKLTLEEINLDEMKKAQKILSTLQLQPLDNPGSSLNLATASIFTSAALVCGVLLYIGWKKWKKPVSSQNNHQYKNAPMDNPLEEIRKNDQPLQPLFSELEEGGDT